MTLKNFLKSTKITIAQFARNTGINENTLNTYIHRKSEPTVTNAIKIIESTHGAVTLNDLKAKRKRS